MMQQGRTSLSGAARRALLRSRIGKGRLVVAPGVFEMISRRSSPTAWASMRST